MPFTLLRSVRFNIYLFCLILASAALGTFLPQAGEAPERVEQFMARNPFWGAGLARLGLFDLYHSAWFTGLLALMAFDVLVCRLYSVPPDPNLDLPREMVDDPEDRLETSGSKPYRAAFTATGSAAGVLGAARGALLRRGYGAELRSGSGPHVLAVRHRAQRWGSYAAHIGVVLLLAGALMKAAYGFEEMLAVSEGSSAAMRNRPWEVHVDGFRVEYYADTSTPRLFASDVRVFDKSGVTHPLEEGRLLAERRILVNHPLSLPGARGLGLIRMYQASWGATDMFRSATLDLGSGAIELRQRALTPIPGTGLSVRAETMLPDFMVGPDGRAGTASLEPAHPAVKVAFFDGLRPARALWLLRDDPTAAFVEDEGGLLHPAPAPPIRLASVDPVLFSGIQVAYDPGIPVLYAGFAVFLGGLSALFYLHRRKVWVWAVEREGSVRVVAGGWSSRRKAFAGEFASIVHGVRSELPTPEVSEVRPP